MKNWKIQEFSHPWKHLIIDNFYEEEDFKDILEECEFLEYEHDRITSLGRYQNLFLLNKIDKNFYKKYFSESYVNEELFLRCDINITPPNFSYKIHDESDWKKLSCIVYLKGDNGTLLYDENKNFVKEVEWKENRALIFCGIKNITWHNYMSNDKARFTANTFLINKIENTSFSIKI